MCNRASINSGILIEHARQHLVKNYLFFFHLKDRNQEQRKKLGSGKRAGGEIFLPLVHLPNGYNGKVWAGQKSGVKCFIPVSHVGGKELFPWVCQQGSRLEAEQPEIEVSLWNPGIAGNSLTQCTTTPAHKQHLNCQPSLVPCLLFLSITFCGNTAVLFTY